MDWASNMAWPDAAEHFANAPETDRKNITACADNRFITKVSTLP